MFNNIREKLYGFDNSVLKKDDPRFDLITNLLFILENPMTRQDLANLIIGMECLKFTKTYPTFFNDHFSLQTLMRADRQRAEFLSKPLTKQDENSEHLLSTLQKKALPHGVFSDPFTECLMDCHQELLSIYHHLPRTFSVSKVQMQESPNLQLLNADLQEAPQIDNLKDIGRGISLDGYILAGDSSDANKMTAIEAFTGNKAVTNAMLAVNQNVYANIGMACSELLLHKAGPTAFSSATGTVIWKKDQNGIYAEVLCQIPSLMVGDTIYRLGRKTKTLVEANEADFASITKAIRSVQPVPYEPIYIARARLDFSTADQHFHLSSLTLNVNCTDLNPRQKAIVYSSENLKHAHALKEWELHASHSPKKSSALIIGQMQKELQHTLCIDGKPVNFIYELQEEQVDSQNPQLQVYAIADKEGNFYTLGENNVLEPKTKSEIGIIFGNNFKGLKPLCIAEAQISTIDNKPKITAFSCTFNAKSLDSIIVNEPLFNMKAKVEGSPKP